MSLNELIQTTGKLLGETLDRKIRLEFDLTNECTNIKADETQIEQVLLNLAINARDAMPDGGLLKFSSRVDNDQVVVQVTDSGTGIDRETLPKIFDPFFSTKGERGTGLGLYITKRVVEEHLGTIEAQTGDRGTTFVISLPL